MCIGSPMKLIEKDGNKGHATFKGVVENVDLSLTPEANPGDFLLVFLGAARDVITAEYAREIEAAHDALRAAMTGGDAEAGFADLIDREPPLPPHLQAALAAGRTTA